MTTESISTNTTGYYTQHSILNVQYWYFIVLFGIIKTTSWWTQAASGGAPFEWDNVQPDVRGVPKRWQNHWSKKLFRKKSFMFGLLGKDIGLTVQISQFLSNLTFSSWQLLLPTLQQGRSVKTDDFDDAIMMMKMKRVIMMTVVKRSNRWPTVSQCSLYSWSQHDQWQG